MAHQLIQNALNSQSEMSFSVPAQTTYEQPLNERIRTLLRLEHLFLCATAAVQRTTIWDSRATLGSIVEILDILGRSDLKNELIKELERHQITLSRLHNSPGVDQVRLDTILGKLEKTRQRLHEETLPLGHSIRELDLIHGLMQRNTTISGVCNFDLPAYHHWLQQDEKTRQTLLTSWLKELTLVSVPVGLILDIIRESTVPNMRVAEQGLYQQPLNSTLPYQLIRVSIPSDAPFFAEISAGKHRFTVRFMQPRQKERALQANQDIEFQLSCCAL